MATEKKLNVRLSLKYDSFENWQKSTLVLNPGEAAIAYIETGDTQEVNSVTAPQTLMKIGNGKDVFKDLPVLTAKAGDVYGWAKAAVKPEYQASEIKGLEDFIAGEIQDTDTQYNIVKVNEYQYKLMSKAKADESFATEVAVIDIPKYDDTQVKADISKNADAITALQGLVGETAVATQITNAITALKLAETYAAKVHTHTKADITDFAHNHEMNEVNGLTDALAGKETAGEAAKVQTALDEYEEANDARVKAIEDDLAEYKTTNDAAVKVNTDAIAAIKDGTNLDSFKDVEDELAKYQISGDYAVDGHKHEIDDVNGLQDALNSKAVKTEVEESLNLKADKTEVEALAGKVGTVAENTTVVSMIEAVDGKATKNAEDITSINETIRNIQENAYDDTEIRGLISDNTEAIEGLAETHATDKAALEASIKSNTDAIALLTNGVDSETVDGVNDLIQYVKDHGTEVTGMKADINTNKDDIDALEGRMDDAETALGTVDTRIAQAIADANLDQYAKDADLDAAVERIAALETADGEQDTLLAGLRTDVDAKATKEEHNALAERVTTAETKLATVEEGAQVNVIETVKVNGVALEVTDKAVDVTIPVGGLASKDKVAEADLEEALATKLNGKAEQTALEGVDNRLKAVEEDYLKNADKEALQANIDLKADKTALNEVKGVADTAVQEVTAGDGLVATRAEGSNTVNIAFDDTITFVLDCGNSEVTA